MNNEFDELREVLLDLTGFLNSPQADDALLQEAGVHLDRALFPLLARIERRGPLGVVELANLSGRDHTTVSRQVAKLEHLGLVIRQISPIDGRVREAVITEKGRRLTTVIDAAREEIVAAVLADWNTRDLQALVHLMRRLADDAIAWMRRREEGDK